MISLCTNIDELADALRIVEGSGYLKTVIFTYLKAYGTEFSFNEFYLQYSETNVTAIIHRYNSYIHLIFDEDSDVEEISSFIDRFKDSQLICDKLFSKDYSDVTICYLMSKNGVTEQMNLNVKEISDSPKKVSDLVAKDMSVAQREDFYLNTAHQLRHGLLRAFAHFSDDKVVSVAGVTNKYNGVSAITFVYTDEYFRGNGYSKDILKKICSINECEYQLLCEENNIEFYKKCGFTQVSTCCEIRL